MRSVNLASNDTKKKTREIIVLINTPNSNFNVRLPDFESLLQLQVAVVLFPFGTEMGLELTYQILKLTERIIEKLIRQQMDNHEMQFGFMPGCWTTSSIFILRKIQEKYLAKNKNLYFAFVDLEKAFDQVPRDVVLWMFKIIQSLNRNLWSRVRVNGTFSNDFLDQVGLHQGPGRVVGRISWTR